MDSTTTSFGTRGDIGRDLKSYVYVRNDVCDCWAHRAREGVTSRARLERRNGNMMYMS